MVTLLVVLAFLGGVAVARDRRRPAGLVRPGAELAGVAEAARRPMLRERFAADRRGRR